MIKPAFEENGYNCYRDNDIHLTPVIELCMYEIPHSELVIVDAPNRKVIGNDRGVKRDQRPFSIIEKKEKKGKLHFDLEHNNISKYEHLGEDIGHGKDLPSREELRILINKVPLEQFGYPHFIINLHHKGLFGI
ncbi:MAG: hypothetical protein OXC02_10360 [Rhodobacteraceae bacterium]|nr:hypothetical protein [Paracoccaceae bacterium]